MQIICDSAEHHFLITLEKLKKDSKDWVVLHFALSKQSSHGDVVSNLGNIKSKIKRQREQAEAFLNQCADQASGFDKGFLYLFSDNDVVLLVYAEAGDDKHIVQSIYKNMAVQFPPEMSESGLLINEFYKYQKLADRKLISASRFDAYMTMCDENKVGSISVRRERRADSVVLLVEDDRFTASYTSGLLNKDFDLVVCRNGEEAISAYIENAPDIVLLDIHLPGLSGHETLQAIRCVDKDAFVVMLSVDTVKDSIKRASELGAKSFLKKPFSKERLINTIRTSPFVRGVYSVSVQDGSK